MVFNFDDRYQTTLVLRSGLAGTTKFLSNPEVAATETLNSYRRIIILSFAMKSWSILSIYNILSSLATFDCIHVTFQVLTYCYLIFLFINVQILFTLKIKKNFHFQVNS